MTVTQKVLDSFSQTAYVFGMADRLLHTSALDALLTVATGSRRWGSRNQLASEAGVHPSTLSNAVRGRRSLPDGAAEAIAEVLGVSPEALWVPLPASDPDWRVAEELRQMRLMQDAFTEQFNRLWHAVTARAQGD